MQLDLIFETPENTTHQIGARTYRLYEKNGQYALPDVYAETEFGAQSQVELQEVRISRAETPVPDRGVLQQALITSWQPADDATGWITARQELSKGRSLPAGQLAAAFQATANRPVDLQATWSYVFSDPARIPTANHVTVRLELMAPGTPVPPRPAAPFTDPVAERLGLPARLRDVADREDYTGFAAVDFGTSSSTVTIYDARHTQDMAIDPGQAGRLRTGLADLLGETPPPGQAAPAWREFRSELPRELTKFDKRLDVPDVALLQARLRTPVAMSDGTDLLLDAVCWAVENCIDKADAELSAWLAPRLLQVYDAAFNVPPLEEMYMQQVVFAKRPETREISSVVSIVKKDKLKIELGEETRNENMPEPIRGLKAKLLEPERYPDLKGRDGREASSDDLIAHVFMHLIKRAEVFAHGTRDGKPGIIRRVVATYPTTTPAASRAQLRELIRHTLSLDFVITDFDEGVAAGLFFLFRDFGSNRREFGAEAIRAHSRKVADDPPTWQQNMLVLDIGAGTTDIALIRLTLTDMTKPIKDCPSEVQGRYYVLRPEVLNSTGHPQLGGNYLTLRVFYWLKAKIADALLNGTDRQSERDLLRQRVFPGSDERLEWKDLASAVVESGAGEPAPEKVREALRTILPTDWHDHQDVPPTVFDQLWDLAEDIKIKLGNPEAGSYVVPRQEIAQILALNKETANLEALLPTEGVALTSAELRTLCRPVLVQAVRLARWLVHKTLSDEDPLDRVVLSGKSSKMPLLRQVVVEELTASGDASSTSLAWNPAAVTVETEYAKQAASIGACWAQSIRNKQVGLDEAAPELAKGRTHISIDVDNLTHTMPCEFRLLGQGRSSDVLLTAGTKLAELDSEGRIGARSRWVDIRPDFQVDRPLSETDAIQWGVFHYKSAASREGFTTDESIWRSSPDGTTRAKVKAQLEVDQTLVPYLYVCQGPPHYVVSTNPGKDLRPEFGDDYWSSAERRLIEVPAAVWVIGKADRLHPDGVEQELFPVWLPPAGEEYSRYFPEFFRNPADPSLSARPGRISDLLPPPPENGDYRFFLRWHDGRLKDLGTLRVPGQRGPTARYVATFDAQGGLAIHRGFPPYWQANTLEMVQKRAGAVRWVRMDKGDPHLKDTWNPFNGRH